MLLPSGKKTPTRGRGRSLQVKFNKARATEAAQQSPAFACQAASVDNMDTQIQWTDSQPPFDDSQPLFDPENPAFEGALEGDQALDEEGESESEEEEVIENDPEVPVELHDEQVHEASLTPTEYENTPEQTAGPKGSSHPKRKTSNSGSLCVVSDEEQEEEKESKTKGSVMVVLALLTSCAPFAKTLLY